MCNSIYKRIPVFHAFLARSDDLNFKSSGSNMPLDTLFAHVLSFDFLKKSLRSCFSIHSFIYNLTALIRKANATGDRKGIDVGELIGYSGFGKIVRTYLWANPGYAKRISVDK